jgi:hypothetical protein
MLCNGPVPKYRQSTAALVATFALLQNNSSVGGAMHVRSAITAEEARAGASPQGRMHMRSKCRGTAQSPAIQLNRSLLGWAAP